ERPARGRAHRLRHPQQLRAGLRAAAKRGRARPARRRGDLAMIVSGQASLAAGREELWAVLADPGRLAQTLPHVSEVSIEDEHRFSAVAHPFTALGETRVAMEFEV